jgi:thiol-disulfide isomerase/thioredoxin
MTRLIAVLLLSVGMAETPREALQRGQQLWEQRLANSAIAALEVAARDKATAAEALEALGRIYTFKGWQQEAVFPGWHDEPAYRPKALAALRASVKADPSRASAQEALRTAETFDAADSVPPSKEKPAAAADPASLFAEAQRLLDAGDYDRAIQTADQAATASDRFVAENLGAYQMPGKAQGFLARGHAQAATIAGTARFKRGDLPGAIQRLEEAERLYQGLDVTNQIVLGDVERARNAADRARDHYLNALSLNASPAQREAALTGLSGLSGSSAVPPSGSNGLDAWLAAELAARREARRAAALRSVVNKPLPSLPLETLDGKPFDASTLKGKVVLLDFFASWCGICKAELPHLKTAYAKYQSNPNVTFLLVSVDEDAKRLQRYLADMKFPFAVARMPIEAAETAMGFDNVPATFYLDPQGIVRYQTNGTEAHGDSPSRVSWYIDQLMAK